MTGDPLTKETTIPEDAAALNLTRVTDISFTDAGGNPIGEACDGYLEVTVHENWGPTVNIYTDKEPK